MDPDELRSKFNGVIAFPITPFKKDLSLDIEGLRKNLRKMLEHPPCALVAAGGTGELYSLSPQEYLQVVKTTVEEAGGKVPVIAGTAYNTAIGVELAKQAVSAGAAGILAFPPYYPGADEEGLFHYYKAIGDATKLGLIIYSRDWVNPSATFAEKLATIPNLIAWKDGQRNIRRFQFIKQRLGDRFYWIGGAGDDCVPAYYTMGIRTYTSSISNVSMNFSWRLHELASVSDTKALPDLMNNYVIPLYAFRARRKGYEVSVMKAMMDVQAQVNGPVRPPLVNLREDELREILTMMDQWQSLL